MHLANALGLRLKGVVLQGDADVGIKAYLQLEGWWQRHLSAQAMDCVDRKGNR